MSKFSRHLGWRAEAGLMHVLLGLFGVLGVDRASALGGWFARTLGPHLGVSSRAERNIRACFPDMSDDDVATTIRQMWDNLGRTAAEYAHFDKFQLYAEGGRVTVAGAGVFEKVAASGKGAVFVSGHFGNWELTPMAASQRGLEILEVYRAANNPYADNIIKRIRQAHVTPHQVPKGSTGARQLIAWLKDGNHIAMLVDQKMNDGIVAPFMGRAAMSPPAAAQLARRFGCPIVPATIRRTNGAHFVLNVEEPIYVSDDGDRAADILAAVTLVNQRLEAFISAYPGQWLWLHRRWPDS